MTSAAPVCMHVILKPDRQSGLTVLDCNLDPVVTRTDADIPDVGNVRQHGSILSDEEANDLSPIVSQTPQQTLTAWLCFSESVVP